MSSVGFITCLTYTECQLLVFVLVWLTLSVKCWSYFSFDLHLVACVNLCSFVTNTKCQVMVAEGQVLVLFLVWLKLSDKCWWLTLSNRYWYLFLCDLQWQVLVFVLTLSDRCWYMFWCDYHWATVVLCSLVTYT